MFLSPQCFLHKSATNPACAISKEPAEKQIIVIRKDELSWEVTYLPIQQTSGLIVTCVLTGFIKKVFGMLRAVLSCFGHVELLEIPWTIAHQAPLSMGLSQQEYWSGLTFPSPGDLPNPGSNPHLLCCRQILSLLSHQGSLQNAIHTKFYQPIFYQ